MISAATIRWAIPSVVLAVLILDMWLAADDLEGNTYSEVLRSWFKSKSWIYYLVALALGVLMGHWGPK